MGNVALEVPLCLLALGWRAESHHTAYAWIENLGDALDDPTLAGCVPAFEDHHRLEAFVLDPLLELDELDVQAGELRS